MKRYISGLLATTMLLSGCAFREIDGELKGSHREADAGVIAARKPLPMANTDRVQIKEDVYVSASALKLETGDPLPAHLEKADAITISRAAPVGLSEVASAITDAAKIPVVVAASSPGQGQAAAAPVAAGDPLAAGADPLASALGAMISAPTTPTGMMQVKYRGSLSGLLNLVASNFNVSWTYTGGRIVLQSMVTRTFEVAALPISQEMSFELGSGNSGGEEGGAGGAGQKASTKSAFDVWAEIKTSIESIVGGAGTFSVSPATGTVSVTAAPNVLAQVSTYVNGINQRLQDQVALSVKVLSVAMNKGEDFQFDIGVALQDAGRYGLALGSLGPAAAPTSGTGGLGWAIVDASSNLNGTNGIITALSNAGNVSIVTSASVTTVSGQPVPLQVARERGYLKNVSRDTDINGTVNTTYETANVTTGFNLHLVPRVQSDGTIMLQYGVNISELVGEQDGFDIFEPTDDIRVQLPNVDQRNFVQSVIVPNGSTLALAGFERVQASAAKTGQGNPGFFFLGGGKTSSMRREVVVILITPTKLDMAAVRR